MVYCSQFTGLHFSGVNHGTNDNNPDFAVDILRLSCLSWFVFFTTKDAKITKTSKSRFLPDFFESQNSSEPEIIFPGLFHAAALQKTAL